MTTADLASVPPAESETRAPRPFGPVVSILIVLSIVVLTIALLLLIAVIASLLGLTPPGYPVGTEPPPAAQNFQWGAQLLTSVLVSLLIIVVAALRAGTRFGELLALNLGFTARMFLIALGLTAALYAAGALLEHLHPPLRELAEAYLALPSDRMALWIAMLAIVIGAPISEELIFRGFLYTSLRAHWGYPAALIVTSVLFAAMHFEGTGLYALLVLPSGFLLGWLRERSGGIAVPIAMHMLNNLIAILDFVYWRSV